MTMSQLDTDQEGFIPGGRLSIRVDMTVSLDERFTGGSRDTTGCIGLKNEVLLS
jgi:hypothetical protein